jgi:hypothetical protein
MQVSDDRFQTDSGWNLQFHPDSAWKRSSETCMKLTNAECTVENFPHTTPFFSFSFRL